MCFATEPLSRGGTPIDPGRLPPFPSLRKRHTEMAYHVAIFPNVFFSLYPDAVFRVLLQPQSATKTVERTTWAAPPPLERGGASSTAVARAPARVQVPVAQGCQV
jgi:phenylpropionate dioxygenase-like ring-hydroxylating dioxygenase large terminal subunit